MNRIVLIVFIYIYILWIRFYLIKKKNILRVTSQTSLVSCSRLVSTTCRPACPWSCWPCPWSCQAPATSRSCSCVASSTSEPVERWTTASTWLTIWPWACSSWEVEGEVEGGRWNAPVLLPHFISFFVFSHLRNSCREVSFSRFLFFQHRQPFPKLKHHPINKVMWHAAVSNQQFFLITL